MEELEADTPDIPQDKFYRATEREYESKQVVTKKRGEERVVPTRLKLRRLTTVHFEFRSSTLRRELTYCYRGSHMFTD